MGGGVQGHSLVGADEGTAEGTLDGSDEGTEVGSDEGTAEGRDEGNADGMEEGIADGRLVGKDEGSAVGKELGTADGRLVGNDDGRAVGDELGFADGKELGVADGASVPTPSPATQTNTRSCARGTPPCTRPCPCPPWNTTAASAGDSARLHTATSTIKPVQYSVQQVRPMAKLGAPAGMLFGDGVSDAAFAPPHALSLSAKERANTTTPHLSAVHVNDSRRTIPRHQYMVPRVENNRLRHTQIVAPPIAPLTRNDGHCRRSITCAHSPSQWVRSGERRRQCWLFRSCPTR